MKQSKVCRMWIALTALAAASALAPAAAAGDAAPKAPDAAVFARVNDSVISVDLYDEALKLAFRNKFYHGKPPEGQLAQLRREVGDSLIERVLLLAEGRRRGITPDAEKTREALAAFDARFGGNPNWQKRREELLPAVTRGLEEQSILTQLEAAVRVVPEPSEAQLRAYFDGHHDAFTEPERLHLSVILLKVDPGAPQAERDKAEQDAIAIRKQLAEGADFAQIARERSGDESAPKGGDMGYLHRGMLPGALQVQIDKLQPGALTEPTLLLEGAAVFRLDDRLPAKLQSFEESRPRTAVLWKRERAEEQWSALKSGLRKAAAIEVVDMTRYPDVAASK